MFKELFDIVFLRWVNLLLIVLGIFYAHVLSRKLNSFYIGIPLLIWLIQAFLFYMIYFGYYYNFLLFQVGFAEVFFSYWSTISKTLGLVTLFIYLYYIQQSCWRGNGK